MERIELLKQFCEQEPEEAFNWYAYALELRKIDENLSKEIFNRLIRNFPNQLPTYFQAADFFAEKNEFDAAKNAYEKGILIAKEQNNEKTLKELSMAYELFRFENE